MGLMYEIKFEIVIVSVLNKNWKNNFTNKKAAPKLGVAFDCLKGLTEKLFLIQNPTKCLLSWKDILPTLLLQKHSLHYSLARNPSENNFSYSRKGFFCQGV
ncbi:hypothetical protein Asal01_01486 [Fodinibius salicampi]